VGSIKYARKFKPSENTSAKTQSILKVASLDFQVYHLCFPLNSGGNNRTLGAIEKLSSALAANGQCFASGSLENWEPFNNVCEPSWVGGLPIAELERKGIFAINDFRLFELNSKYKLCAHYPPSLPVPNSAADLQIEDMANTREGGQFPVVTWRSITGGMLLIRAMAQLAAQSPDEDLVIVRIMMLKAPNRLLRIYEVGPKRTYSYSRQYSQFLPECLELPSQAHIEHVFNEVVENLHSGKDINIIGSHNSTWSGILSRYMEQIAAISKLVDSSFSVLIQGTRKNMGHLVLITILQVVCDPSYRTLAGLCILLEKDWIQTTFPFREHTASAKGSIPVFELTLHILWMLIQAHPTKFEYDERVLAFLLDHLFSCRFVTFCISARRDWDRLRLPVLQGADGSTPNATSVWAYIQTHARDFRSLAFDQSTIPAEYWPSDVRPASLSTPATTGATTIGQCPHMLPVDSLAPLPMIWRERFLQYDFTIRSELVKAASLAKPGIGNSIYSLSPALRTLLRIPYSVISLPRLTILHFKNAALTSMPLEIVHAPTLEEFSVAGNPIRHIPEAWVIFVGKHLKSLKVLDLEKTSIGFIILSIHKHIPTLQTLRMGSVERLHPDRPLEISATIPPWPLDARLETLELPSNGLFAVPPRLVNLVHVTSVDLSGNRFANIPLQLECFTRLNILNFADNVMPMIVPPQGGFRMDSLSILNLSGNGLTSFPDHLGALPSLRSLSLARNKLPDLPQRFFMQYKLLDVLDLSCNNITQLPASVGYMSKLTYFDLSGNSIVLMPDSVVGMTSLKYLDLSYNKLPSLSVCFGRLKSLNILKIASNAMTVLPPHLGSLRDTLQQFDFSGNELVTPPLDILKGGSKAVLDFLYDSLSGSKPIYRMKLMIVGEENVGKTTLVDQLTRRWKAASSDGFYEPVSTLSTDGISISTCSFRWKNEGEKKIARLADEFDVNISWWDFAGQELYYTTHQFFLSGRSIFVVVWNLEKPIEESRVEFWLNSIQSKISTATVVLVGTHLDSLKGTARDALPDLFKQTKLRLRMLFPSLDIIAYSASARTGEGMNDLKDALEKKIVTSKHMGEVLPTSYLLLERMVMEARITHAALPIVSKHKLLEMSSMCNISGEKELFRASNLLHNLGTLIYFEQDLVLSRYVILDPQWLAKLMSTLITTKHSFVTAGVISHRVLGQIWREFPLAMYGFLLGLLEKFEVTYNLTGFIDPASLTTPTALQLISLQERLEPEQAKRKQLAPKKSKGSAPRPMILQQREWLDALIPMLKRHPDVVIGNSPMRRHGFHMMAPGNRFTVANLQLLASSTSDTNLRNSMPSPHLKRIVSVQLDPYVFNDNSEMAKYSPNVQRILERGDVVGSFDLEGASLIPSLLPAQPPPHFESSNMFPALTPPGEVEVTRDYLFDFVPEGLISRLTVRLLQRFLDQTKEFIMWKEGILLVRPDCTIFAHFVQPRNESKVLRLHVRGTDFLSVGRVFSAALEANGILFREWSRLRINQEIVCPHCLAAGIDPPTYFPLELMLDAVRDDLDFMTCAIMFAGDDGEKIQEFKIPLEKITPDFRLVYIKGQQLKYSELTIEKQIGVGGFAVVYKGTYHGETIAIKQLHVGQDQDPEESVSPEGPESVPDLSKKSTDMDSVSTEDYTKAFNEFRKEAFMLTDIVDEHCVRMKGVCFKPFCLVTEFVPCGDLYSLCHKRPLKEISWPLRLRIALDMAKGMNFMHSLRPPIIHNDLKSPNVLLSSLDPEAPVVAKISDFGLSMRMSKMYTRLVDNPVWIAPEIMRGQTYDSKADVYAFGVMLWEMLERRGFFEEIVFNSELERRVMAGERPVIENDTLPEYEKLIRACWDNDPLRRPPFDNVIDLLEQLIVAFKNGATKVGPSSEMSLPGAQRGRRAGIAKPAEFRDRSTSINSDHSTSSSSLSSSEFSATPNTVAAADAAILEPEIEEVEVEVKEEEAVTPTVKVRANQNIGARKGPSRADIIAAQQKPTSELDASLAAKHDVPESAVRRTESVSSPPSSPLTATSPSPASSSTTAPSLPLTTPVITLPSKTPTESASKPAVSSMARLNMLLGASNAAKGSSPNKLPSSHIQVTTANPAPHVASPPPTAASCIRSDGLPTVDTSPSRTPNSSPLISPQPATLSPNAFASAPTSAFGSSTAANPTASAPSSLLQQPPAAIAKFHSRELGRPVSINTALNGSITGLLSNLQSLADVSESLDYRASTSVTTPQVNPPIGMAPIASSPSSSAASSIQAPPSVVAASSSSLTSTAPKLISEADAKLRMAELNESLKGMLKFVVAMAGSLRSQDSAAFQTAVLDTIKFMKTFRDIASTPAGFKAINPTINEKLILLRDSIKALCSQVMAVLQVARLVVKQDPSATTESFAASASSFVASFKITSGVMELAKLDGVQVLEIEPVELY